MANNWWKNSYLSCPAFVLVLEEEANNIDQSIRILVRSKSTGPLRVALWIDTEETPRPLINTTIPASREAHSGFSLPAGTAESTPLCLCIQHLIGVTWTTQLSNLAFREEFPPYNENVHIHSIFSDEIEIQFQWLITLPRPVRPRPRPLPGIQPADRGLYTFGIDKVIIHDTRSRHEDTVWLAAALQIGSYSLLC